MQPSRKERVLPIKSLKKLNSALSLVMGGFAFIFVESDRQIQGPLVYTAVTFGIVWVIGLANVKVIQYLYRRYDLKSKNFVYRRFFVSYSISAVLYLLLLPTVSHYAGTDLSERKAGYFFLILASSALVNSMIILLHNIVLLQNEKAQGDLLIAQLRVSQAEATNLLLKAQIQPHFLFNALNTVKALYRKENRLGDTYVVHLASFLRASIYHHESTVSTLESELEVLTDYLEMQKIRFGNALQCEIFVPESLTTEYDLPTFSLQPMLENAFKHNEFTEELPLQVTIEKKEDRIIITNNVRRRKNPVSSTHHGLANLSERYRLISGDEVLVLSNNDIFSVSIKLLSHVQVDH